MITSSAEVRLQAPSSLGAPWPSASTADNKGCGQAQGQALSWTFEGAEEITATGKKSASAPAEGLFKGHVAVWTKYCADKGSVPLLLVLDAREMQIDFWSLDGTQLTKCP